jgi:hypothetical protein
MEMEKTMKTLLTICVAAVMLLSVNSLVMASYSVTDDFETSWSGDYAANWDNEGYRHGEAPGATMQQVDLSSIGRTGHGVKLTANTVPNLGFDPWWAAVNRTDVDDSKMLKQYDPWLSVDYYDAGHSSGMDATGQLYAVPSWVNMYTNGEDWTDVQFGGRSTQESQYYYVAAGQNSPGWQTTGVSRSDPAWVNLKMQLSSVDGKIHFYINDTQVGTSYRSDYIDLTSLILNVNYDTPLSAWGENKPSVIFDNFTYGSSVPEPATMCLLGLGGLLLARRKK